MKKTHEAKWNKIKNYTLYYDSMLLINENIRIERERDWIQLQEESREIGSPQKMNHKHSSLQAIEWITHLE